jgi:hypothetical protein
LKKRLLRTVLEEIVVNISDDPPRLQLRLHWCGGVHTELVIAKNTTGRHRRCTDRDVVELARELAKVCDDKAIAGILNRLGYHTGHDNTWTLTRVKTLRSYHGIPPFDKSQRGAWVTLDQAAGELGVNRNVVRTLLVRGILPATQVVVHAPWVIERQNLKLPAVQAAVAAAKAGQRIPRQEHCESQVLLFQQGSEV